MVFFLKRCLIGFYLKTLALDGQRENGSITGAKFLVKGLAQKN